MSALENKYLIALENFNIPKLCSGYACSCKSYWLNQHSTRQLPKIFCSKFTQELNQNNKNYFFHVLIDTTTATNNNNKINDNFTTSKYKTTPE